MDQTLNTLRQRFPQISFREGTTFFWSPETKEVHYDPSAASENGTWSLLHETSHALLEHISYKTDFELVRMEVLAWEKAKKLAAELGVVIDEDHIQDCLDSYRDWLYSRSICPRCANKSLQQADLRHYRCFNCHEAWQVTPSRFCRAYRATKRAEPHIRQFEAWPSLS